jgi:hypothetical protein
MNDRPINTNDAPTLDSSKKTYQTHTLEPLGPWTISVGDCVTSPENC